MWSKSLREWRDRRNYGFDEVCEVVCFDHHESCSFRINECDREDCLRNLWHLHGQIASLKECEAALDSYVKQTPRLCQHDESSDTKGGMSIARHQEDVVQIAAFHNMNTKASSLYDQAEVQCSLILGFWQPRESTFV